MATKAPTATCFAPRNLDDYLALPYRLEIVQGEYGGYVVSYPDLPGCMTQVERQEDAIPMGREILEGWLEIALEENQPIPLPPPPPQYSGRFLLRMSKSLHRRLAEAADAEGVSLNAHISNLLTAGSVWHLADRRVTEVCAKTDALRPHAATSLTVPQQPPRTYRQATRPKGARPSG